MFSDLNGLSIWMAYSSFFSQMGVHEMFDYYEQMLRAAGTPSAAAAAR
jgi:hypothetical protein